MKKWLVRNSKGRLFGPLTTDEVLKQITYGDFTGDEMISLYPGGEWRSISKEPDFYDHLLSIISGEPVVEAPSFDEFKDDLTPAAPEPVPPVEPPKSSTHHEQFQEEIQEPTKVLEPQKEIINLEPVAQVKKKKNKKKLIVPLFLFALTAILLILIIPSEKKKNIVRSSFLLPKKTSKNIINKKQEKLLIKKAVFNISKDTFKNYVIAQEKLVRIIEKAPKSPGAYALLCLTYYELWPYTKQSSNEISIVSAVQQRVSIIDSMGLDGATCRVVQNLISENNKIATEQVDSVLARFSESDQPPTIFYYFKSILLDRKKDYLTAINYLGSVQKLWPSWIRLFSYEAQVLEKAKDYSLAARRYVDILKANKLHKEARIALGVLEFDIFNNPERAKTYIEQSFKIKDKIKSDLESKAYRVLAQIYLGIQDQATAIKYAKKSIFLDPFSEKTKRILKSLGQEKILNQPSLKDRELVYYGDQFLRDGDCNGAQAHYKSAHELNPKNAIAAYKAAKCLWELSLSTEATNWLDKAIKANPKYLDAYILLADYLSQRFKYEQAGKVLGRAMLINPSSYTTLRGYALVEYRRNNFKGAVNYAGKALKIYEADVESLIILSQSLVKLRQANPAFSAAAKAIEINSMNRKAQTVYAKALSEVQGVDLAIQYLEKKVRLYPLQVDYRLAMGHIYLADQQYRLAADTFLKASEINENSKAAFMGLGTSLKLLDDLKRAQTAFLKAAVLDPSDVEPIFQVGLMFFENNKFKEAYKQFLRVQNVNPNYPRVHYLLGKTALSLNKIRDAVAYAKKEQEYNPSLVDSYILMADIYGQRGDNELCIREFQKAIKLQPQGAHIYIKMAVCYRKSGNLSVAMTMLKQAQSIENGNADVYRELGKVFESQGNFDEAARAYSTYLELAPNAIDRGQIQNSLDTILGQ